MYYDKENVERMSLGYDDGYKCCICGRECSKEGSMSNRGKALTCITCIERISKLMKVPDTKIHECIWNYNEGEKVWE